MTKLNLHNKITVDIVSIPGAFIDRYMPSANGEFVKVYLYLLRSLNNPNIDLTVSHMADVFDCPENDIIRAFRYWEKNNVLSLHFDENNELTDIQLLAIPMDGGLAVDTNSLGNSLPSVSANNFTTINPANYNNNLNQNTANQGLANYNENTSNSSLVNCSNSSNNSTVNTELSNYTSTKTSSVTNTGNSDNNLSAGNDIIDNTNIEQISTSYTPPEIKVNLEKLRKDKDFSQLLLISQRYMGKLFKSTDCDRLAYLYELFNHSQDVIEYLVEYCVDLNHSNFNYMEKVALDWHKHNLNTVTQIKQYQKGHNVNVYSIMKAFGIHDRQATTSELDCIERWIDGYKLPLDIILLACNRTIDTIHKPSFKYTESIIKNWSEKDVKTVADIEALDNIYETTQQSNYKAAIKTRAIKDQSKFNNFEQRKYDYDDLDAMLYGYTKKNK